MWTRTVLGWVNEVARAAPMRVGRRAAVCCGAAVLVAAPTLRADIYRTEDSGGVISFTNRPLDKSSKLVARSSQQASGVTPVMPRDTSSERFTRYDAHIRQAATLYQIPEELVRAVIKIESNFDPGVISPKNARGLMQLIPATAERMMVTDVFDPRQNIFGGTRYLRVLANLFNGDLELTIAAYNAGEGAVMRHGGIPPYEETRLYVTKVLAYYRHFRAASATLGAKR